MDGMPLTLEDIRDAYEEDNTIGASALPARVILKKCSQKPRLQKLFEDRKMQGCCGRNQNTKMIVKMDTTYVRENWVFRWILN